MRAPLLLPLLPLLLHGVSSEDNDSSAGQVIQTPEESKQTSSSAVTTGKVTVASPASTTKETSPITVMSTTTQGTDTTSKPHGSAASPISLSSVTTTQEISTASSQGIPSITPASTHTSAQSTKTTDRADGPSHVPGTSTSAPQNVSSSASPSVPASTSAATTSATQQQTSTPGSTRSFVTAARANSTSAQVTSTSSASGGLVPAVTTSPHIADDGGSPLDQGNSIVSSSGVPTRSLQPEVKGHSVSPSTSVTSHSHPSPISPVQNFECATTHSGSVSSTSRNTSLTSPSSSTKKASVATTMTTPKADPAYTSQGDRSVTHKPGLTAQSPTSALPPTSTPQDQIESKRPDQPHLNISLQNKVICEDQPQEMWPIINLKEAKTCDDWNNASANESFFEFFCSGRRHAFDSKRDRCTVTLAPSSPHRWAVHAVVHRLLDPEAVFEELKEKRNELQKLGITNVTYLNQEMEEEIKDQFSTPLIITIITLAGSLLLVAAIYGCCHQRFSQKKSQHFHPDLPGFDDGRAILIFNRLTEELQTMENGYHDNPTLEVMETGSEMQEKKMNLNGELGDSWIVPLDTIMKEDLEEEEDTHL
ncbi:podocalyxin isoform X2 [Numida meleagris]|uniref:podocalyxin isoform X2 n=1 Tax=Numida meleagris TaxID=8996 RepID=UPI000B3DAF7E|nr:podocalyxin isoform X2 [Numida meleagris]